MLKVPDTLNRLLVAASTEEKTGLRFLDRRERETWSSWGEIYRQAALVAGGLRQLGIRPGDRVAVIFPTGPEFIHSFFGALLAGAVPVPLYPPVRLGRLDEYHQRTAAMLEAAGARLVLTSKMIHRLLGPTVATAQLALGCRLLKSLPSANPVSYSVDSHDLALVQFSSGTTFDPKPVALSHRAILAQVQALNRNWPDHAGAVKHSGVSWLPLYHDMGLIGCIFPALERPGTLTLIGPEVFVARPAIWLRALSRYQATVSVAPNFAYGLCVDRIQDEELDGVDLQHWRVALNGAEAVAPSVLRAFQHRFAAWGFRPEALTPVYGLSEATLAVTFSDLDKPFESRYFNRQKLSRESLAELQEGGMELVSVGRPLPGTDLLLVDEQGCPVNEGKIGHIRVRGPSVMDGYLDRPEATREVLQNGWLDTGDLGFLHEGELFLTARAKDVVILKGRNYAPMEIEQAVNGVEGVRVGCTVAVSRLAEGAAGEELVLFVEHTKGAEAEVLERLPQACKKAVLAATGLMIDQLVVLEPGTLPRTSSGKLRRREALLRYDNNQLTPPKRVTPWLLTGAMARSALAYARRTPGNGVDG